MKIKSAFSLVELSIVILVIGTLVAAISEGGRLVRKAKLATARTLTEGSPANSIDDMVMWFDTTSNRSFITPEVVSGSTIDTWNDIKNASGTQIIAYQIDDAAYNPIYVKSAINGLPALKFTKAGGQYLSFDGSILTNDDYTIFIVDQRSADNTGSAYVLGGGTDAANKTIVFGYADGNIISGHQGLYNISYTPSFVTNSQTPRIYAVVFSGSAGKTLYINGYQYAVENHAGQYLTQYSDGLIGKHSATGDYQYDGYLGELIFFKRNLDDKERNAVERYLSKKWGVALK